MYKTCNVAPYTLNVRGVITCIYNTNRNKMDYQICVVLDIHCI